MIARPLLFILACLSCPVLNVMAMRGPDSNEDLSEDHKIWNWRNYALQMAGASDGQGNIDNTGISYDNEPFDSNTNPEDLSALIVDYANMLRNDVIWLDNSVETGTPKRGNIKVEKKYHQATPDTSCSCNYKVETKDLGKLSYPRYVETRKCINEQNCLATYVCKESYYNVTILRKQMYKGQESLELPKALKSDYIAEKLPISVGCVCRKVYKVNTKGSNIQQ